MPDVAVEPPKHAGTRIEADPEFAVDLLPWRSDEGIAGQTLIIKATFVLEPGVCSLATNPEPLYREDRYWEDFGVGELRQASDMVHSKRLAEVLLVGSAFARRGAAQSSIVASFQIGSVSKRLTVQRAPSLGQDDSRPAFFVGPLPIRYSRTHYGPSESGCVAPLDQRLAELTGSETLVLEHLHPEYRNLITRLPGVRPAAVLRSGGQAVPLSVRADSLTIDTDRKLCTVTWRGQVSPGTGGDAHLEVSLVNPLLTVAAAITGNDAQPVSLSTMELQPDWVASRAPSFIQTRSPSVGSAPPSSVGSARSEELVASSSSPRTSSGIEMLPASSEPSLGTSQSLATLTELLWYQRDVVPRLRSEKAWQTCLRNQRNVRVALAPNGTAEDPTEARDVLHVLANAEPSAGNGIGSLMSAHGSRPSGPLALLDGDLEPVFSLSESLAVTLAALAPIASESPELLQVVEQVEAVAARPGVASTRPAISMLIARLHTAAARCANVPDGYLDRTVESALVEHRRYDDCTVMGHRLLRLLLHTHAGNGGAGEVLPVYAPPEIAERLPARRRFRARIVAELRARVEQSSPSDVALRAYAIGYRGFAE